MKTKRTIALMAVSLALILSILACGGGKSPTPTAARAEPTATEVSAVEPTAPEKPAKAEPSATPEASQPTQEISSSSGTCADMPGGELSVAFVSGYQDTLDSWRIIGLVCNKTSEAVNNIQLDVELFDKDGKSLYKEQNVYTALNNVDAGEETPFSLSIYDQIAEPDKVKATIISNDKTDLKRATVDTQGVVTTVDDDGNLHITGELINNGQEPVEIHGLAAATFGKDGQMFTADYYSVLIHYLAPGVSGPFRVTMYGPKDGADSADDYQLYIDAETTDKQEFLISAKDDLKDLTEYVDAYGQFHLVGELTNSGDKNIGVRLVATIYDKDKKVIDASSMDTAISAIKPGESLPYEFNYWGPLDSKQGLYDEFDTFSVQVDPTWTWTTDTELVDLQTASDTNEWDEYQGTFKGQVVNDSGGDLESAVVIVGIWGKKGTDNEDKLVAMGYSYADITDKLANGKSAEYSVYVPIPKDFNIDNYEYDIFVKGRKP